MVASGNRDPLYNIGVVARMTGVSMATLRAWERRYNFPESERTAGGHRLFSEYDVLRLRWVKERIEEGMQTAQAINALHHQELSGNLTLVEQLPAPPEETGDRTAPHLSSYKEQVSTALAALDLEKAGSLLGEVLAVSAPEDVIVSVIGPALAEIGEAWETGNLGVAGEHLASNYLRQRLLMWMASGPPPKPVNPVLLACAPSEWHEGSLLMLGALLRRRRWPVAYLGQSLPFQDLSDFMRSLDPSLVVLVAMTESSAAELAQWPDWLPQAAQSGKPAIGFGGRIYTLQPGWQERTPGVYLGDTIQAGLAAIERLLLQAT